MEGLVLVEDPETPPLFGDRIGIEALGAPGLLYGGGGPADNGVEDAAPELVYWFGGDTGLEEIPLLVRIDSEGEAIVDEGMPLVELPPP
jgi:hypothetical protein